jgi:hypothetical protein
VIRRRETRETSGDIGTSNAATLWAQSQSYTASLTADKAKAEEQRDKLMAAQSTLVVPLLTSVNEALKKSADSDALTNAKIDAVKQDVDALLELVRRFRRPR